MPTKSASSRDLAVKIEEVKQKLILLEGDRRTRNETSEQVLKANREKIVVLMDENKSLRKKLSEKNKTAGSERQIIIGEDTNGDLKNKLNLLRYETKKKEKILKESQKQNGSTQNKENLNSDVKEKQAARDLENRLDKTNLKQREAEHIQRTYQQIKAKLEHEHKTYDTQLDEIQQDINRMKTQMTELETMNGEALASRDAARVELERREKEVYAERRRMELEMQKVRKEADEKRMLHNQLISKRQEARHSIMEELTDEQRQRLREEEEEESIRNYENFFRVIKDATGVSETQEVITRFEMQGKIRLQLNELKQENENTIETLTETKQTLEQKYEQLIYFGDNSAEKKEEFTLQHEELEKEKERNKEVDKKLKNSIRVLVDAKTGIDHLDEKLQPIKLNDNENQNEEIPKKQTPEIDADLADDAKEEQDTEEEKLQKEPEIDYEEVVEDDVRESDAVVLSKLDICQKKLATLASSVEQGRSQDGKDMKQVCKEMEELEFQLASEIQLPVHNTRIFILDDQEGKEVMYAEDEQSGDDEEILTRDKLKKQSQMLVDSKNKRTIEKRKKYRLRLCVDTTALRSWIVH